MDKKDDIIDLDVLREMSDLNMFTEAQEDVLICLIKGMGMAEAARELGRPFNGVRGSRLEALRKYDNYIASKKKS